MDIWRYLMEIHRSEDWTALVIFYGAVLAVIIFVCLQLLLVRSRRLALRATGAVRDLLADMKALESQLDELERRTGQRLDSRDGELDARMTRKIDSKGDLIQDRIDQRCAALSDAITKVDSQVTRAHEEVERFRQRLAEVEGRIPSLFDRLDEFRGTLAKTFQAELGGVLNSFDNTMSAILQQMKSELQMGVSRIEGIESMVRSRDRAERTLLGAPDEAALPESASEEEEEFGEWEQQAKELAERDQPEEGPDEIVEAVPLAPEEQGDEYPAEMGESETDASDEGPQEVL